MKVFIVNYLFDYSGWEYELIAVTDTKQKAIGQAKKYMKEYGGRWEAEKNDEWFQGPSCVQVLEEEVI